MTPEAKRIKKYHDSKYVSDNPDKFDPRDVTRARGFIEGVEMGIAIAEKAVEEEEQHWEGDTTIQYAFDNLLSRIKSELNSSGVNKTEIGGK